MSAYGTVGTVPVGSYNSAVKSGMRTLLCLAALSSVALAFAGDFQKATQRVYFGGADGSRIQLRIME